MINKIVRYHPKYFLMRKALDMIEELCTLYQEVDSIDRKKELVDTMYRFAHVSIGRCENKHEDWKEELENAWLNRIDK